MRRSVLLTVGFFFVGLVCPDVRGDDDAPPLRAEIDRLISAAFSQWDVSPADPCPDATFLRRVSLDLTGAIPQADSVRRFLQDAADDKRAKLVDRLLDSDAYARHMAIVFDVMLMERRPDKYVPTGQWRQYLAESFAQNKPLDQLAREILGADGVDPELRPAAKFYLDRAVEKDTLVRDIGRLFLGVDLKCAQCHDHPEIDDYLHRHYHGLSVFVAGSKTFRQEDGTVVLQEMVTREVEFASVFNPDQKDKTGPRLLDALYEVPEFAEGEEYVEKPSRKVRAVPKFSLRQLLAEKLPGRESPEFARNMANRLWALMMGRGLVQPLHMHHSDNPPSHPELLKLLADRLVQSGFDCRWFLRELALSQTYQRSSRVPDGVEPDSVPPESFAVANMKGLSPEQLFESLLVATRAQAILEEEIDAAVADEAPDKDDSTPDESELAELRRKKRAERVAEFVDVFGGPAGRPDPEFMPSLPQSLFLANSETVAGWLPPKNDNLTEHLLQVSNPDKFADELYLSVLSRRPLPEEREFVSEQFEADGTDRPTVVAGLVWSLLASAEFRLNH